MESSVFPAGLYPPSVDSSRPGLLLLSLGKSVLKSQRYRVRIPLPHSLENNGLDCKTSRLRVSPSRGICFLSQQMEFFSRLLLLASAVVSCSRTTAAYSRNDFPPGFVFGAGTSAYQVEGAAAEDGRTPSVWDQCIHAGNVMMGVNKTPAAKVSLQRKYYDIPFTGMLPYNGTGDVACDEYHKYKEDVQLMKKIGLDVYRFSISWSRLIPNGRGPINPKGLQYYNNLIDELISNGIQPHVTLFHYDMPQALEDEYQGWLSPKVVKDFKAYADVCFREFGDRVLHWTTINEANVLAMGGYDVGQFPPLRCSYPYGSNCTQGDSTVEPYIAAHHMLLAHAAAAGMYKKYQAKQRGLIGFNVFIYWFLPSSNSTEDVNAAQRAQDFYTGWFLNPLVFGDYPETMKKNAGPKIPAFTQRQSEQIMASFDFFGLNHYTTLSVSDSPNQLKVEDRDFIADMFAEILVKQDGFQPTEVSVRDCVCREVYSIQGTFLTKMWTQFSAVPSGLRKVLEYFQQVYGNPPVYIHENGFPGLYNETLEDTPRVEYLDGYIKSLLDAVSNGSNARGYFVWSFMDCFELLGGYEQRYGLYRVDFDDKDLKRYPKLSAHWYSRFLKGGDVMGIKKIHGPLPKSQFVE